MHLIDSNSLKIAILSLFLAVFFISYAPFYKTTQNFKTSTPKKEIMIKKTVYTSTSVKINIKSVQLTRVKK